MCIEWPILAPCEKAARHGAENHELRNFFQFTLGIADATWKDALEDLKEMKESSTSNIEIVRDIYRMLWREFEQDESNGASIRHVLSSLTYPKLSR